MNAQANEIITADVELPIRALTTTPHDLLAMAVQSGANMETLERLMDLQDRWDAKQAKNAFTEAMAEFKKNPPEILKRKLVSFETRAGDKTEYRHAEIGDVCNAVVSTLGEAGFSHNWKISQEPLVEVTCVVTHRLGHSESVTLKAGPDATGGKNAIQAIASTVTYLERYTLLAAVGLATNSMDDDGRGFDQHGNPVGATINASPHSGVWASLDAETQQGLELLAISVREFIEAGDVKGAYERIERDKLGVDEKTGLWGLLRSDERSALKRAAEAAKVKA